MVNRNVVCATLNVLDRVGRFVLDMKCVECCLETVLCCVVCWVCYVDCDLVGLC